MFIILNQNEIPLYVTGVEDVASKYCKEQNAQFHNGLGLHYIETPVLSSMDKDCAGFNELVETVPYCELDIASAKVITPGQRQYILNQLGFTGRGKGLWYHKCLGDDIPSNRFYFNLGAEDLSRIPTLLLHTGYNKFKEQLNLFVEDGRPTYAPETHTI